MMHTPSMCCRVLAHWSRTTPTATVIWQNPSVCIPIRIPLKTMMQDAGFESVDYYNLTAGVVALHRGYKF